MRAAWRAGSPCPTPHRACRIFLRQASAGSRRFKRNVDRKRNSESIDHMKAKTTGLTLALCLFRAAVCFADDPEMGTWKLNEAKSKFSPGTGRNNMVVSEAAGDNALEVTVKKNGKVTVTGRIVVSFDGKSSMVTTHGTDTQGGSFTNLAVYDRQ